MNIKSETISFGKRHIRVIRDSRGGIQRFCLNDLCAFLGHDFIRPSQDATRLCPKSVKLPFKLNGHRMWSITPSEVKTLTAAVLDKKPGAEPRCRKLEEWITELNAPETNQPVMDTRNDPAVPVTFNYQDCHPVSFRIQHDRLWINATQLTKCFNRQPIEWLRLKDTIRLRKELAEQGRTTCVEQQIVTVRGRNNGATWMEAPLALELAGWLSPELTAWCQECIREMTSDKPVEEEPAETPLKALHPEGIDKFPVPKTFSEALQLAADLQEQLEQNEPKVAYYEDQIETRECFSTTRLADEMRITAQQLNRFLEDQGVCRRELKQWVACGEYRRYQTEVPYMFHSKRGKVYKCGSTLRWNQQGRQFIIDLWKTHHPASHE